MSWAMLAALATSVTASLLPLSKGFVAYDQPVIAITHASIIDGRGTPPKPDQTLVMQDGRIVALGPSATTPAPAGATVIDGTGKTLIPGLVLVHEHLFYPSQREYLDFPLSFQHLYLAGGETTIRTGGSINPIADLNTRDDIAAGRTLGPDIDVSGPYLTAGPLFTVKMLVLKDAVDAKRTVDYWAGTGVTSFKAYMGITRAQLGAAVKAAHAQGRKVTGHLCSVTYREAAGLGIDNLEHGFGVMTDFTPGKTPDVCPEGDAQGKSIETLDPKSPEVQSLFRMLIDRKVAVTSTLAVFEARSDGSMAAPQRALDLLTPQLQASYWRNLSRFVGTERGAAEARQFQSMLRLEKAFVDAGGTLLVGTDPTGIGGVVPGYGGRRAIELLVEAGFTPVQAISFATWNGARYLGRDKDVGTLEVGKRADLAIVEGDPAADIKAIERMPLVFKAGVGVDTQKVFERMKGVVGLW
jgi:enamidase